MVSSIHHPAGKKYGPKTKNYVRLSVTGRRTAGRDISLTQKDDIDRTPHVPRNSGFAALVKHLPIVGWEFVSR